MPTAYFYARVSTLDQAMNGYSLKDQKRQLKSLYRRLLKPQGYTLGPLLRDRGVSAWKYQLFSRGDGQKLQMAALAPSGMLQRGDCVVIDKLNRAFRNVKDIATTVDYWRQNGVRVVIRELQGIDTDSAMGKFMVNILGVIAQFESDIKSERMRERNAIARENGQPMGTTPLGFRQVRGKRGKNNKLVPDWRQRSVMAFMLTLSEQGVKQAEIKRQVLEAHKLHVLGMRAKVLTPRQLEVLEAFEQHGGCSQAARALGIGKQAVRMTVKACEKKLPKPPLCEGLDMSQVSVWLTAARKFRSEGVLINKTANGGDTP